MKVLFPDSPVPSSKSLSSRRASRLSFRSCRSISWLILLCSFASSLMQHAIMIADSSEHPPSSLSLRRLRGATVTTGVRRTIHKMLQPFGEMRKTEKKNHPSFEHLVTDTQSTLTAVLSSFLTPLGVVIAEKFARVPPLFVTQLTSLPHPDHFGQHKKWPHKSISRRCRLMQGVLPA